MAEVTICSDFGAPSKIKSATVSTVSPSICHEVMGPEAMIFVYWMLSFKPTFSLFSIISSRGFFYIWVLYIYIYVYTHTHTYIKEMCAKSFQSCLTLCNPMDCSLPRSSVHEILQARIMEWIAMCSSRGSSWRRDLPASPMSPPALAGKLFTTRATWEARKRNNIA